MLPRPLLRIAIPLTGLALAIPAVIVQAQDLLELPLEDLMNVRVTSTSFFDETPLTSASSVTHLTAAQWNERGSRNLADVLNTLPGTFSAPINGGTGTGGIRGFFSINTGLSLLLDDVPLNQLRPGNSLEEVTGYDLALLQSVEEIRGPGSAIYGADAFVGVLSLQSVEPAPNSTTLHTSLGTQRYGAAAITTRFEGEPHSLTAAVAYRNLGDQNLDYPYTDPDSGEAATGTRHAALENSNLLLKYRLDASTATRLYATLYTMDMDADDLPGVGRGVGALSYERDKDLSQLSASLRLLKLAGEQDLAANNMLSVTLYGWQSSHHFQGDLRTTPLQVLNQEQRDESRIGLQVIDRHTFSDSAHLALGYEYSEATIDKHTLTNLLSSGVLLYNNAPQDDEGYVRRLNSLIMDGRVGLLSHTSLVYGGRLDDYNDFDRQFSPRFGLLQTLADKSVLKLQYGRAYRAPNLFEMFGTTQLKPNPDLQAETMDTLELVYQRQTFHWLTTVNLFQNWWKHAIRGATLNPPEDGYPFQFQNAGKNQSHGIELVAQGRWDLQRLNLDVTWTQSENVDTGQQYEAFPTWIVDLGWGYRFAPAWDLYVNNRLLVRDAASEPSSPDFPIEPAKDYFRTDLTLSWSASDTLTTRASIINLFDRTNYLPSYYYHESGIPDDRFGFSVSVDWAL